MHRAMYSHAGDIILLSLRTRGLGVFSSFSVCAVEIWFAIRKMHEALVTAGDLNITPDCDEWHANACFFLFNLSSDMPRWLYLNLIYRYRQSGEIQLLIGP